MESVGLERKSRAKSGLNNFRDFLASLALFSHVCNIDNHLKSKTFLPVIQHLSISVFFPKNGLLIRRLEVRVLLGGPVKFRNRGDLCIPLYVF